MIQQEIDYVLQFYKYSDACRMQQLQIHNSNGESMSRRLVMQTEAQSIPFALKGTTRITFKQSDKVRIRNDIYYIFVFQICQDTHSRQFLEYKTRDGKSVYIWVVLPRTGKMSNICHNFFWGGALLWPNGLIF